jgi:diguanylate cyclase (GGDEF)-like protein
MTIEGIYAAGVRLPSWLPPVKTLVGFPLAYFALGLVPFLLATRMNGVIPLWIASAALVVALVRSRASCWPVLLALGFITDLALALMFKPDFVDPLVVSAVTLCEAGLIAGGLRRFGGAGPWYLSGRWIALFVALAIFGCALISVLGSAWFAVFKDYSFLVVWRDWIASDSLGFLIGVPFLLSWTEPALRRDVTVGRTLEAIVLAVIVAGVTYFAFTSSLPLLFLVFPFLSLITLRTGLAGATVGALTFAAVVLWFTVQGQGPIAALPDTDAFGRSLVLQAYFLTAVLSTVPISIFLTFREALTNRLRRQDAISNAALDNMVQGLCMFDAEHRLIICNRRYGELYPLPDGGVVPGMALAELLDRHVAARHYWGDPAEFIGDCLREAEELSPHREVELHDGRIIDVHRSPLETGGWVETHEDVTEQRRAGHRIAYLAIHDVLTGLANRVSFNQQLDRSLAVAQRGHGFALQCLDLDRFKAVNDTLGHAAGDELLRQVAERLRQALRSGDLVARLGGDEFAIIQFPIDSPDEASGLAAKIVELLGAPYELNGQEANIGASIGIAMAPADGIDAADILQKADLALYRAKTDGRNTYRFFESGMDTVLHKRRVMERELRLAVQKGEFELHYQPIINVASGKITSLEALIRWRHPTRGLIQPDDFLPLAEESGLILPIGEWVLRHACREAAGWPDTVDLAVNLSPVQFKTRTLPALVSSALETASLAPARLALEITEGVLLQDSDGVLATLNRLHDIGVSIAMDDFGTGYSSLSYLRAFPFDKIKIDRSFVRDMATSEDCMAIIHATTTLSEKLGMGTTAEGVETAEQMEMLRAEGCTEMQGFHISPPLPAGEVRDLLARHAQRRVRQRRLAG